jgi:hypothetical protein
LFEWPLPEQAEAQVGEVARCLAFLQRKFGAVERVELLLEGQIEGVEALEEALGVEAVRVSTAPYGSLVMRGLAIPETTP